MGFTQNGFYSEQVSQTKKEKKEAPLTNDVLPSGAGKYCSSQRNETLNIERTVLA